ncbi:Rossmann-like and DUF2520 domain-containing protein [Pontibacter burrus]|uniref:DUF2520 domain-containing protein n=1 Tax=Pontibacter burrus TaxID=2704466 RepID=A0A6B3LST5_9BACT|nr:Rossmann-like and DUF2520 domain-containing protein [Pontibacter burrus]NEM96591.1 DUF2520 domain-containing protein [Pontibacter burrus]
MNITIVGAGNVAWHLAQALQEAGNTITAVYSRTLANAAELAIRLPGAAATDSLNFSNTPADIILIAVPDGALADVAERMKVQPQTIVAHTSGSQPVSVLQTIAAAGVGVFYPVQTFSKRVPVNMQQVPILIEGTTNDATSRLQQLAQTISSKVGLVNSEKRKQLHLAAVFACNFTNHLLGISRELLAQAGLPSDLLQPLINETISKAAAHHPFTVQTGPAVRNDQNVIHEHLQLLRDSPELQEIYRQLTRSIQQNRKL